MNLSKQIDNRLDDIKIEEEIEQMIAKQKKLKSRRSLSLATIHAGETFILFSALAIPFYGLLYGAIAFAFGGAVYGTARILDKKIVNKYNELDSKISDKYNEIDKKMLENSKAKEKEANVKVENKIVATKTIEDEIKEA